MTGALFGTRDAAAEDAAFFGIDPALLDTPEEDGVWPENLPALEAFMAICDQWRTAGSMGRLHFIGLDYTAAEAGLRLAGIETTPELWGQVRLIEGGARVALNEE